MTSRTAIAGLAALAILTGVGFIGYALGFQVGTGPRMSEVRIFRNVVVQVGDDVATAFVDEGPAYGLNGATDWVDAAGSWHSGGWPDCLPHRAQARATFGGALIVGPTGTGSYRILWVDCRS